MIGPIAATGDASMDMRSFIATVEELAGIPHEQAEEVTCDTLDTLSRRISKGETEVIARLLPKALQRCLHHYGTVEKFHLDEFVRRIQQRTGLDRTTAQRVIYAVFVALHKAIGPEHFAHLRAQLPGDFVSMLDAAENETPPPLQDAPFIGPLSYEEFLDHAAERAGVDHDRARRATEAVLEVLAMRITAGQAEDLRPYVPPELRPALDQGLARSGGRALPLSLDAFIEEITQREGVSWDEAAAHARAVLHVLHEAVPDKEFRDTIAQLPRDYDTLIHA